MTTETIDKPTIVYPESDGLPMADNTIQYEYIVTIKGGLDGLFAGDANVFVAGDLLWYPVEGHPEIRTAPDVMVAFGRPKGDRGSYRQWDEDGVAPQVVFEIHSPGNRPGEMTRKTLFYERYGVEEYYLFDPETGELTGLRREGDRLVEVPVMDGFVSPRLRVRFEVTGGDLHLYGPDGKPFEKIVDLYRQRDLAEQRAEQLAALLRQHGIEPPP
jgi:Uma2 family endonuclease